MVQQVCDLLSQKSAEAVQESQKRLFQAAVASGNLQAVNLTLRYCQPPGLLSEDHAASLWTLAVEGLDMVGLLWKDFRHHSNQLLQVAVDKRCQRCIAAWHTSLSTPAHCTQIAAHRGDMMFSLLLDAIPSVKKISEDVHLAQRMHMDLSATLPFWSQLLKGPCILPILQNVSLRLEFSWWVGVAAEDRAVLQNIFDLLTSRNSSLKELAVVGWRFAEAQEPSIMERALGQKMLDLRSLRLVHCNVTPQRLSNLMNNHTFPLLEELDLSQNPSNCVTALGRHLSQLPSLHRLRLRDLAGHFVYRMTKYKSDLGGYASDTLQAQREDEELAAATAKLTPCRLQSVSWGACSWAAKELRV